MYVNTEKTSFTSTFCNILTTYTHCETYIIMICLPLQSKTHFRRFELLNITYLIIMQHTSWNLCKFQNITRFFCAALSHEINSMCWCVLSLAIWVDYVFISRRINVDFTFNLTSFVWTHLEKRDWIRQISFVIFFSANSTDTNVALDQTPKWEVEYRFSCNKMKPSFLFLLLE